MEKLPTDTEMVENSSDNHDDDDVVMEKSSKMNNPELPNRSSNGLKPQKSMSDETIDIDE